MKYIRTKDGITTSNIVTHELLKDICCAGYLRELKKGAYITVGKKWTNFYGEWVDLIDEKGTHYSIKPDEVKEFTKELPQADTIEELCDYAFVFDNNEITIGKIIHENNKQFTQWLKGRIELGMRIKLAILTDKGLIYVAKLNNEGELELI